MSRLCRECGEPMDRCNKERRRQGLPELPIDMERIGNLKQAAEKESHARASGKPGVKALIEYGAAVNKLYIEIEFE